MKPSAAKRVLVVLIVLLSLGFLAILTGLLLWRGGDRLAARIVLEVDLSGGLSDRPLEDPIARAFGGQRLGLRQVVEAVDRAAGDDRVVALVARVGASPGGMATVQELRDAITRFTAAGKRGVAWAETFGEFAPGNGGYYLASAFDEIYLQPSGDVGLTGLLYETIFYKAALEKLGLEPRLDRRHEYKNAPNSYTHERYTEPHEEVMSSIVRSHFDQLVAGIADGRGLSEDAIRDLFDRGPFLGREALDAGLVDVLAYRDEVFAAVREEIGSDAGYVDLASYAEGATGGAGTTVALINGLGSVVVGESEYDPFTGDRRMGSETIAEAFRDATDDDGVEAILFRVDSPGGSYVASDTIWRETIRARDAGKPVIVSMGDVAGSGGYFVAMAADAIVAHPGTLTGSIGVYGGKLVAAELWDKIGIGWDGVVSSENARMWSGNHDFSDREWGRMQASLDRIYADFTAKVAAGRGLEPETVERIARGRIWTGAEALENGLVDELGGYPAALSRVREALDLAEGARLRLREFPRPKSTFELLSDLSWTGSGAAEARLALQAIERLRPVLRAASRAGLFGPGPQALSMPEVSPLR